MCVATGSVVTRATAAAKREPRVGTACVTTTRNATVACAAERVRVSKTADAKIVVELKG